MRPYSFVFGRFLIFPVITFTLKAGGGIWFSGGNAWFKVITKNNTQLRGYYGNIKNRRNTKEYGLMGIKTS